MIPDDIAELPDHWKAIRDALAAGDRPEAIKRLRLSVDHDPFALAPRHVLAALLADSGQGAVALVQYEKLLTAAVTRGDLFRAIAAQRRIDELTPRTFEPATYTALQRWFRLAGEANLLRSPSGTETGLTPVRLLRLPPDVFAWVAFRGRLQRLEPGWHIEPFEGTCQWNLMWGALRWEVGRAPHARQRHLIEGDYLLAALDPGDRAPLRIAADVPSEAVVFDSQMLRQLATVDPGVLAAEDGGEFVRENRSLLPTKPGTRGDLDERAIAPRAPRSEAPPTMRIEPLPERPDSEDPDAQPWLEPGFPVFEDEAAPASEPDPAETPIELPGLQRNATTFRSGNSGFEIPLAPLMPPRGRAGEIELPPVPVAEPVGASAPPPAEELGELHLVQFEEPGTMPAAEPPSPEDRLSSRRERRGGDRSAVRYRGRVRLLGLGQANGVEMDCQLLDLSATGVRLELPTEAVLPLVRMLAGETLRIELEPSAERLQLAGRVCWLDVDLDRAVQAGLEFVLITRADRRAIRRLVARAGREAEAGPADAEDASGSGGAAA